jgi:hypothetical protein
MAFRPRGGQDGIAVTREEMIDFSNEINSEAMDEFIPLPRMTVQQQKIAIGICTDHDKDTVYYETETGSHGWCCSTCGKVVQWG